MAQILKKLINEDGSKQYQLDWNEIIANKPKIITSYDELDGKPKIVTSWNDLEDKPFHDDLDAIEVIVEETELTLEESSSNVGKYQTTSTTENTLGLRFNEGETLTYIWNGVEYKCETKIENFEDGTWCYWIGNCYISDSTKEDTLEPFVIMCLTNGSTRIYQIKTINSSATLEVLREYKGIKYLDSKFIKDMYYDLGIETVEILPQTEVPFSNMGGIYGFTLQQKLFELEVGKTYIVNWDGTEYECVADVGEFNGDTAIGIGNRAIAQIGEDTGEPFIFGVSMNYSASSCFTTSTASSHLISLSRNDEIIKQIPSKYVDAYTKQEIDAMFGAYVDEVNTLLGGE